VFTGEKLETLCLLLQRAQPAGRASKFQNPKTQRTRSHGAARFDSRILLRTPHGTYYPAWAVCVVGVRIKFRVKKDFGFRFPKKKLAVQSKRRAN
jgi:hypothetical protein